MRHTSTGMHTVVRLHSGDSVIEATEQALKEGYIQNAMVNFGIGSLSDAEFGTLPAAGPHVRHAKAGPMELVSLSGLIIGQTSQGPYNSHLHIAVADASGALWGGHLFRATVGAFAEVGLTPLHGPRMRRVRDEKRGTEVLEI